MTDYGSGDAQSGSSDPVPNDEAKNESKDRPLTLVRQVQPQYPEAARKERLSGSVQLEVVVDEEGSVESAKAVSGNPILAEAAASAVRRWTYHSAIVNGKPVRSTITVKLKFEAPQ